MKGDLEGCVLKYMKNKIIPYNPNLKVLARKLRKNMILSEILLWQKIRNKSFGVEFHRQLPIDNYIVDFYCHELKLVIEIDGDSHNFDEVYENDIVRQKKLESLGIQFIRFDDIEVKKNMNNVLLELEQKVNEIKTPL